MKGLYLTFQRAFQMLTGYSFRKILPFAFHHSNLTVQALWSIIIFCTDIRYLVILSMEDLDFAKLKTKETNEKQKCQNEKS